MDFRINLFKNLKSEWPGILATASLAAMSINKYLQKCYFLSDRVGLHWKQ